jgi:hypothetical protein
LGGTGGGCFLGLPGDAATDCTLFDRFANIAEWWFAVLLSWAARNTSFSDDAPSMLGLALEKENRAGVVPLVGCCTELASADTKSIMGMSVACAGWTSLVVSSMAGGPEFLR